MSDFYHAATLRRFGFLPHPNAPHLFKRPATPGVRELLALCKDEPQRFLSLWQLGKTHVESIITTDALEQVLNRLLGAPKQS